MRITARKLRHIIRRSIVESMNPPEDQMTPEEEEEYYEQLIAQHEEMEDGRYEREDALYRKQIGESRRRRRILRESLHGHMDGNITNLVLHACHLAGGEFADITVQDVLEKLQTMSEAEVIKHADPARYDTLEYNEYFVSAIRQIDYQTVTDKMFELVELGELEDGYEDFFGLPGAV